jgi:hypothetical protein
MAKLKTKFIENAAITSEKIANGAVDSTKVDASIALSADVTLALSGKLDTSLKGASNGLAELDANGLVPIGQIPPAALERFVVVPDEAARFALTTANAQNGDTVKQQDTGEMFFIKDETNLGNASGYAVYTAGSASSVPFSGVTGLPTTLSGYGITDAVPNTRTVNSKALSADITLDKNDIGLGNVDDVQQLPMSYLDTDALLAADSDTKVASQKAVKAYVDAGLAGKQDTINFAKEILDLLPTDISNGYVNLQHAAKAGSIMLIPVGGPVQTEGVGNDYTVSVVGGVSRITFAGDLLALDDLDTLIVSYAY